MKIRNTSKKVLGFGKQYAVPGDEIELSDSYARNPVLMAHVRQGRAVITQEAASAETVTAAVTSAESAEETGTEAAKAASSAAATPRKRGRKKASAAAEGTEASEASSSAAAE